MARGTLFDGTTADRHEVGVEAGSEALLVGGEAIPADQLAVVDEDREFLVMSRKDSHGWRLTLDQPVDPAIRSLLPKAGRYGSWIDRVGIGRASALFAGVAAVVLFVGYSAPAWLAPVVPESWERNLGSAMVGDFGEYACRTPQASSALAGMAQRVEPAAKGLEPISMTLIDVDIFNAAALPGGQVVIFDGALAKTDNPDAMAGILAHEIAHVRRRHVTQALIRELGIGALIRLFAGDVGANAEQLVGLSFTRSNEAEADADAIEALRRAGIDPRPTAALFRELDKEDGGMDAVTFLNSHPRSGERAASFAASYDPKATYRPVMSKEAYAAMRGACPKGERKDGFWGL